MFVVFANLCVFFNTTFLMEHCLQISPSERSSCPTRELILKGRHKNLHSDLGTVYFMLKWTTLRVQKVERIA